MAPSTTELFDIGERDPLPFPGYDVDRVTIAPLPPRPDGTEAPPLTGPQAAGIPMALVPLLERVLAKDPAERVQTASELIDSLLITSGKHPKVLQRLLHELEMQGPQIGVEGAVDELPRPRRGRVERRVGAGRRRAADERRLRVADIGQALAFDTQRALALRSGPADIDGSGDCLVGLPDLGALLASYGKCPGDPGYNADADLTDADLTAANLIGAQLSGANLYRTDLSTASMLLADLADSDLQYASLFEANLTDEDD